MFEIDAGHRFLAEKSCSPPRPFPVDPWFFFWVSSWSRARDPARVSVSS